MEGISDIRIVGIDAKRPPVIRKQPYIDIFFTLSHKVPKDWSEDFNNLLSKQTFSATVRVDEGLYIETWVRTADDIAENLALLTRKVAECNERYIARVVASQSRQDEANGALRNEPGEQGRLNRIIADLVFEA